MQYTCDAITIAQFGLRGVANPLLEYALSNEIGSDHLTMSDGVWTDQETCIARRNWVPFQTLSYATELNLRPFEFGNEGAANVPTAVANEGEGT